jgi:hypothetical protein
MNYKLNTTPVVGANYTSISKTFVIERIIVEDNEQWVHYFDKANGKQYSCLLDAFLERFKLTV